MGTDLEQTEESRDKAIQEMLLAYQGPEQPLRRPSADLLRRRLVLRRLGIAATCLLAALVGVALFAVDRQPGSTGEGECAEVLVFQSVPYSGNALAPGEAVVPGSVLGLATEPGCSDDPADPGTEERAVQAWRVSGVSPTLAIMRADRPELVYLADGRCSGTTDLVGCLETSLTFEGVRYSATYLHPETAAPENLGRPLGRGILRSGGESEQTVPIVQIQGIAPSRAVAVAGQRRTLYVADGHCYLAQTEAFVACLRGS